MTSLVGFALGDILAQVISGSTYNLARTLRMTLFGVLMDGPVGEACQQNSLKGIWAKIQSLGGSWKTPTLYSSQSSKQASSLIG